MLKVAVVAKDSEDRYPCIVMSYFFMKYLFHAARLRPLFWHVKAPRAWEPSRDEHEVSQLQLDLSSFLHV